jgi:hypothetical protein
MRTTSFMSNGAPVDPKLARKRRLERERKHKQRKRELADKVCQKLSRRNGNGLTIEVPRLSATASGFNSSSATCGLRRRAQCGDAQVRRVGGVV